MNISWANHLVPAGSSTRYSMEHGASLISILSISLFSSSDRPSLVVLWIRLQLVWVTSVKFMYFWPHFCYKYPPRYESQVRNIHEALRTDITIRLLHKVTRNPQTPCN